LFALLKFLFFSNEQKAKNSLLIGHYQVNWQKLIVKIMDSLIDYWPLTGAGEITFELTASCLPILIGD